MPDSAKERAEARRKLLDTVHAVLFRHDDLESFRRTKLEGPGRVVHDARTDRAIAADEFARARDDVHTLPQRAKLAVDAGQTDEAGRLITLKQNRERDVERLQTILDAHDNRVFAAERTSNDFEVPILQREAAEVWVPALEFIHELQVAALRGYLGTRARYMQALQNTSLQRGPKVGAPGFPRPNAETWQLLKALDPHGELREG